jgi:N-acetylglucosamine kinase-like BadF-type ATPase
VKRADLLAVDAGGSKVDAAAIARSGTVLASVRVDSREGDPTLPGHLGAVGLAVNKIRGELGTADDGAPVAGLGVFCLADADLPVDERAIGRVLDRQDWCVERELRNDTFAILRAGTEAGWGVAVVCGHGTNCTGVAPDGRTYRLPALGVIAGDWGGGGDLGEGALWYAMRARDGRGVRTRLADDVPAFFGYRRPRQVMEAIHLGRLRQGRLDELAPVVFAAAAAGDAVATSLVERQADEIVTMVSAAIRRLKIADREVPVVLGGGVFRNGWTPFHDRIHRGVHDLAPRATITVLDAPPIVGAALLGMDGLGASSAARNRVRATLTHEELGRTTGRREED